MGFQPAQAQVTAAQAIPTESTDEKIQQLELKLDELDQRIQTDKPAASVTANGGPFTIRSADDNFVLRLGADLQLDHRTFPAVSPVPVADQTLIRRARPTISGTVYQYIDFFVRPDFGLGQVVVYDLYAQLNYFSRFNLRVGKFKPPVGLERLQSDDDTNFIERGLPTLLVPSRDFGYQLSGDIVTKRVSYAVGVFNGVPDNSLSDASVSDHSGHNRDYAGRIFLTPFLPETKNPLSGLGVGMAVTRGNVDGLPLPAYKTLGQNTLFTFASGVTSAGHRTRLAPQGYYYRGPFGILSEYTLAEEGFERGGVRRNIALRSWQVAASYVLTGEKKGFGTLVPRRAFDPQSHFWGNHGWGAIELAARVGDFSVEQAIFKYGFANAETSPRRAHEWVGGVSWYLNRMFRISADYGNTNFGGGAAAGGNRSSERVWLNRVQINF